MQNNILQEQLAYYRARAQEYDESVAAVGGSATTPSGDTEADQEWEQIVKAVHALAPVADALELACGTGIWTRELLPMSRSLTALDGSPEMIQLNQAKLGQAAIKYECVDLFTWEPDHQYDLVFFAFWLSHVPPSQLTPFLNKVARATRVGGRVFIVDEPKAGKQISGVNQGGMYQQRGLRDGSTFQIVKVYYDPKELQQKLQKCGFQSEAAMTGNAFFYLNATRAE